MFAFICVLFIELSFKCSFTASFFISVLAFIWHLLFKCTQFDKYFFFLAVINVTGWSSNFIPGHSDFPLGIICDRGSFEVHFGDHLRYCTVLLISSDGDNRTSFGVWNFDSGIFFGRKFFQVFFWGQLDLSRDKSHYGSW